MIIELSSCYFSCLNATKLENFSQKTIPVAVFTLHSSTRKPPRLQFGVVLGCGRAFDITDKIGVWFWGWKIVIAQISRLSEILFTFVTANGYGREAIHICWHLLSLSSTSNTWQFWNSWRYAIRCPRKVLYFHYRLWLDMCDISPARAVCIAYSRVRQPRPGSGISWCSTCVFLWTYPEIRSC